MGNKCRYRRSATQTIPPARRENIMPSAKPIQKLKPALQNPLPPEQDGILPCLDSDGVTATTPNT